MGNVYYIVEHQTRGVLMDMPYERDEKPHFAWSVPRSRARYFPSKGEALNALKALPDGCYVLSSDGWRTVEGPREPG
jgi:hypothetical protein